MVTLRRMFLAVTNLSSIFSPFQQQVLDPLANARFMKPLPSVKDLAGDDSQLNLSSDSLKNFRDRKILNTLQLLAVSSLLQMRQGFQLVQGDSFTINTLIPKVLLWEPLVDCYTLQSNTISMHTFGPISCGDVQWSYISSFMCICHCP